MTSKTLVLLEDDLTGGEAEETVEFALDGKPYAIDLNEKNAERLREALGEFIPHPRKLNKGTPRARQSILVKKGGKPEEAPSGDSRAIRSWAEDNGYEVSAR